MSDDANDMLETAVKVAMAKNSKSSIMFLLRERLIREVIETAIPIIVKPYLQRIAELEQELEECGENPTEEPYTHVPKIDSNLSKMKEAADDVRAMIEDDDPPII